MTPSSLPNSPTRSVVQAAGDSGRCVHIGDRKRDIYELFCVAHEMGTHFLIRTCVDRLAGDGGHTIADEMEEVSVKGLHRIEAQDNRGDPHQAVLATDRQTEGISGADLTVIHAEEHGTPKHREKFHWKLITDCRCNPARRRLRNFNGMPGDGKSRYFIRSSSPDARPGNRGSPPLDV